MLSSQILLGFANQNLEEIEDGKVVLTVLLQEVTTNYFLPRLKVFVKIK